MPRSGSRLLASQDNDELLSNTGRSDVETVSPKLSRSRRKVRKVLDVDSSDDDDDAVNEGDLSAIQKSYNMEKKKKSSRNKKPKIEEDTKQTKLEAFISNNKPKKHSEEGKVELKKVSVADYFNTSISNVKTEETNTKVTSNDDVDCNNSPRKARTTSNVKKDSPKKSQVKENISTNYSPMEISSEEDHKNEPVLKKASKKLEVKEKDVKTTKNNEIKNVTTQKNKKSPDNKVKEGEKKSNKRSFDSSTKSIQQPIVQKPKDQLWVDKYSPKSLSELVNQHTEKSPANKLLGWLKGWAKNNLGDNAKVKKVKPTGFGAKNDGTAFKAALLSGPPGIGKTTCATLACKELGLNFVQLNASDARGKKILQQKIEECLQTQSISSFFKSSKKPNKGSNELEQVLIMDEVDGMSGSDDRAGISELILMIKNSKIPIICICNDRFNRKIASLANHCFDLRFTKPNANQVRARLMAIASKEKMKIPLDKMMQVAEASNFDIRQSIYNLQLIKCSGQVEQLNSKDVSVSIFDAARQLLDPKTSMVDRRRLYFTDYGIMPLFIQENYVNIEPVKLNKKETLKALKKSADVLSYVDMFEKQIRTNQDWGLLNDQCTFAGILVPNYMQGYLSDQIAFPSHLGKLSTTNKRYRMLRQVAYHMSTKLTVDETTLVTEVLPLLRKQLADPLIKKGADGIPEVIDLYNQYCLTKEDHEFIVELTDWSNSEEIEKDIPSKIKAAFTRALNKEDRKLPYADLANDVVKVTRGKKTSKKEVIKEETSESSGEEEVVQDLDEIDY